MSHRNVEPWVPINGYAMRLFFDHPAGGWEEWFGVQDEMAAYTAIEQAYAKETDLGAVLLPTSRVFRFSDGKELTIKEFLDICNW